MALLSSPYLNTEKKNHTVYPFAVFFFNEMVLCNLILFYNILPALSALLLFF